MKTSSQAAVRAALSRRGTIAPFACTSYCGAAHKKHTPNTLATQYQHNNNTLLHTRDTIKYTINFHAIKTLNQFEINVLHRVSARKTAPKNTIIGSKNNARWPSGDSRLLCRVKHPLFVDEVLVHEESEAVGVAKVTYYPIDGQLKGIKIGLELKDGTRRDFPLIELRRASPEETRTLSFERETDGE